MANASSAWMEVFPAPLDLYACLCTHIIENPRIFSYGGFEASVTLNGHKMHIDFTGRGGCGDAWDFIDDILTDTGHPQYASLLTSRIDGGGFDGNLLVGVRKLPGEMVLKRRTK